MDETRWHHHWYIGIRRGGRLYDFLRKPRRFSMDAERVDQSIFAWGVRKYPHGTVYTLSILGVLHGLTGLTLLVDDESST